jgi:hypothetical protein
MRWLTQYHQIVASYRPSGVINLATVGEPERTERRLKDLSARIPEIARHL